MQWNVTALSTTFVSATQVTASVPASLIASPGSANITVTTSGGTSASAVFTINPPLPTISNISPNSVSAGGAGFTLTVNGTNYISGSSVQWNVTALSTTFVSATQVTASVPASLIASPGSANITVTTTAGTSAPATLTVSSGAGWYSSSWGHRKAITINHAMVSGGSNLTNFPFLFSVTDPDLMSAAYGGQVAQSNGNDILFAASDGITKLNYELDVYMASSGTVAAWVQIPSLSPNADTLIYVYYGNTSATNQQNPNGVWDSNYKGVWHFGNGVTFSANDSTSNGHNGTISNATAGAGEIGSAASFNGSNATVNVDPNVSLNTTAATISFWINPNSVATSTSMYGTYSTDPENSSASLYIDTGEPFCGQTANVRFVMNGAACTTSNVLSTSVWTYVVIVYDGTQPNNTTKVKIYRNGVPQTLSDGGGSIPSAINILDLHHQIGRFNARYFNGRIDEVRLSNSIRQAAWIVTEYNNQSSPSTFFGVGPQQ